jgi:hypothetical protein
LNTSAFNPTVGRLVAVHGPSGDCLGITDPVDGSTHQVRIVGVTGGYALSARPLGIVTAGGQQVAAVGETIYAAGAGNKPDSGPCGRGDRHIVLDGGSVVVREPTRSASAVAVAHLFLARYQAGDAQALEAMTDPKGEVTIKPGDLGTITDVRWEAARSDSSQYPGTVSPAIDVPFTGRTTGSPDGTIPKQVNWIWGLVLVRRSTDSPWLVIDDGVG